MIRNLIISITGLAIASIITVAIIRLSDRDNADLTQIEILDSSDSKLPPADLNTVQASNSNPATFTTFEAIDYQIDRQHFDRVLEEISIRLDDDQSEEALNELEGLLNEYDELSDNEKYKVLIGYARFFMENSQFEDGRFFYEQILLLPELEQTARYAVFQMLARFALYYEQWDTFLAYNEQYIGEGGPYNWIVTGQLLSAYWRLGNYKAAGEAMLLHLDTGLDPRFDGSDEQYERRYGDTQNLPLLMSDPSAALELAQRLVDQFDRMENWRVLAAVYEAQGDQLNHNRTISLASDRGFLDESGSWFTQISEN